MNVGEIAEIAFDAVDGAIPDAIHAVTLGWVTKGAYNFTTGAYAETAVTDTGRVTFTNARPSPDPFPDYTRGASEEYALLEGLTTAPQESYTLTVGSDVWHVTRVQDIAAAGSLFWCLATKVLT